jgi:hypothetical protein
MKKQTFKCPQCGSCCFGTSFNGKIGDTNEATVHCHWDDDPSISQKKENSLLPKDFKCTYNAKYNDKKHWIKT